MSRLLKIAEELLLAVENDNTVRERSPMVPMTLKDGTPNPDSEKGRARIIHDVETDVMDVFTRASILKRIIARANDAKDRREFSEQLLLLNEAVVALKDKDVPNLAKTTLEAIKTYEKARGRTVNIEQKSARKK